MKLRANILASACLATVFALAALPRTALADTHYPIIELTPIVGFDTGSDVIPKNGKVGQLPAQNGSIDSGSVNVNGSATLPITKAISFTYARNSGVGSPNAYLSPFFIPGAGTIYPGGVRDLFQNYELTEHIKSFTLEEGLATRTRNCCPNVSDKLTANALNSFEWHIGTLGLTWVSPSLKILNHGVIVLNETLKTQRRNPSPDVLAAQGPLNIAYGGARRIYETTQAATAVIPVDPRGGFVMTGTFVWGYLDFFQNEPFPYNYNAWFFTASKRLAKNVDFVLKTENVQQRLQGNPFPGPNAAIRAVAADAYLNVRLDFNQIFHK